LATRAAASSVTDSSLLFAERITCSTFYNCKLRIAFWYCGQSIMRRFEQSVFQRWLCSSLSPSLHHANTVIRSTG